MPKRVRDLWPTITSFENLYRAYLNARKGKRFRGEALRYAANLEENLIETQNRLLWKEWKPGKWRQFEVFEPKRRTIQAPCFADRVVHHALIDVVEPIFLKRMIPDTYACILGRGTHAANIKLRKFVREATAGGEKAYALQTDISKFFPSIPHDLLLAQIARTIADPGTIWLFEQIVRCSGFDRRGIPIGALTSQLMANIYLSPLDHFIKSELRLGRYLRYMDDTVTIHRDRPLLVEAHRAIKCFVENELDLRLNPKTHVYTVSQGVDFCGYRVWPTHTLPRKRNVRRAHRKLRGMARLYKKGLLLLNKVRPVLCSYLGYMEFCSGNNTVNRFLASLIFGRGGK